MSQWRLIQDGPGEGAWNMAVDEAIAESCRQGLSPPTLRLYRWTRPALTIGYFQKLSRDIEQAACRTKGITVIRRITGGRAVLHGNDLTYSVASGIHVPELPNTVRGTFLAISRGLIEGLLQLGVQAETVRSPVRETGRSPICFMSASWYEITINGRKIIGSAQRRWKDGMLQQGSLLFEFDPAVFYKLFRFSDPTQRKRMMEESPTRVGGLYGVLPTRVHPEIVSNRIASGFEKALAVQLKPTGLTAHELEQAHQLTRTKYSDHAWNRDR
jgi:lipoate-protein ligase A